MSQPNIKLAARARHWKAGASVAALLTAGLALSGPAWAAGGNGLPVTQAKGGLGGVDGSLATATGQAGMPFATGATDGGGGAVDTDTGNGAPGGAPNTAAAGAKPGATGTTGLAVTSATTLSTTIKGGAGGAGAGGGGGGGVGVSASADVTVAGTAVITGGSGFEDNGAGGGGSGAGLFSTANVTVQTGGHVNGGTGVQAVHPGGGGGEGGAGVVMTGGVLTNSGALTGGTGEASLSGGGGDGGNGVDMLKGGTIVNAAGGVIAGGTGGSGAVRPVSASNLTAINPGAGGAGIVGAGVAVVNAGSISGGAGGTHSGWTPVAGDAIRFVGGVNTLEIDVGSTITGNVVAFSTADTLALGGATGASFDVSQIGAAAQYQGFGIFNKTGAGTWTLTGTTTAVTPWTLSQGVLQISSDANLGDASGGLTFNGGTLETTADIASARTVTMAGAGTLLTDAGTTLTLSGPITGAGALTKDGAGLLVLTGADSHTGGTTIAAGTLQVGSGGTTGSLNGDVADAGTLAFDRSDAVTFAGTISGTGSVSQIGTGETMLSAANTYSGGTVITGGTLAGSATSFGSGAIQNGGALVIDQPSDADFANPIDGTGTFTKTGAGRLNYTGTGTLSGQTTIAVGELAVNGSLASSAVTVMSGATLSGSGTVGATTVAAGGFIAPGNSIGTLHVNGAYVQAAGATYQVQLDPNSNASDLIAVIGTATLAPGAIVNASKSEAGNFRLGTVYTVLSASGGVSGTYTLTGVTNITAFLGLKDSYDARNAYLSVVQTADPATAAQTSNQTGVASGLPSSGDVTTAILNSQSGDQARQGFDALSGDGHAATQGVLVNDSRLVRDLAIDRLQSLFCGADGSDHPNQPHRADAGCIEDDGHTAAWGQAFGAWGHTDGNGNAGNVSRSTGGLLMGLDRSLADWRLGGFMGYSHTSLTLDARTGSGEIDSYHFGLYGGRRFGAFGFEFGGAHTDQEISSKRIVVLPNFFNRLSADYGGQTLQGFAQVDWRTSAGPVELEPFASLAYVAVHTDHFVETGGMAALSAEGDTAGQMFSTLGVRPSYNLVIAQWQASLHGVLGWRHDFGPNVPSTNVRFVAGGDPFTVEGVPLIRDAAVAEVSLDMKASSTATFGLTYGAEGAGGDVDQTVRASFHVAF